MDGYRFLLYQRNETDNIEVGTNTILVKSAISKKGIAIILIYNNIGALIFLRDEDTATYL